MTVYVIVEWVDGIPEYIRVYRDEDAAEQYVRVLGRPTIQVLATEVIGT